MDFGNYGSKTQMNGNYQQPMTPYSGHSSPANTTDGPMKGQQSGDSGSGYINSKPYVQHHDGQVRTPQEFNDHPSPNAFNTCQNPQDNIQGQTPVTDNSHGVNQNFQNQQQQQLNVMDPTHNQQNHGQGHNQPPLMQEKDQNCRVQQHENNNNNVEEDDDDEPIPAPTNILILKRYRIGREIGKGAFGLVHHCTDIQQSNERLAIKLEQPCAAKQILKTEMTILRTIQGPGVVKLVKSGRFVIGDSKKIWSYAIMELLGPNLTQCRKQVKSGMFEPEVVVQYVSQVLYSLLYIHSKGVTHRDVKPANMCLSERGVILVDFGLARKHMSQGKMRPERHLVGFRGTSRYASIRAHEGKDLGPVDDLWSLFYVTVELLQGSLPWRSKERDEIFAMKKRELLGIPPCLKEFSDYLKTLDYGDPIDYVRLSMFISQITFQTRGVILSAPYLEPEVKSKQEEETYENEEHVFRRRIPNSHDQQQQQQQNYPIQNTSGDVDREEYQRFLYEQQMQEQQVYNNGNNKKQPQPYSPASNATGPLKHDENLPIDQHRPSRDIMESPQTYNGPTFNNHGCPPQCQQMQYGSNGQMRMDQNQDNMDVSSLPIDDRRHHSLPSGVSSNNTIGNVDNYENGKRSPSSSQNNYGYAKSDSPPQFTPEGYSMVGQRDKTGKLYYLWYAKNGSNSSTEALEAQGKTGFPLHLPESRKFFSSNPGDSQQENINMKGNNLYQSSGPNSSNAITNLEHQGGEQLTEGNQHQQQESQMKPSSPHSLYQLAHNAISNGKNNNSGNTNSNPQSPGSNGGMFMFFGKGSDKVKDSSNDASTDGKCTPTMQTPTPAPTPPVNKHAVNQPMFHVQQQQDQQQYSGSKKSTATPPIYGS